MKKETFITGLRNYLNSEERNEKIINAFHENKAQGNNPVPPAELIGEVFHSDVENWNEQN